MFTVLPTYNGVCENSYKTLWYAGLTILKLPV